MPTVVTDASALAAILFDEVRAEEVARQIEGQDLTAPLLLRHELVSVAMKKHRSHPHQDREWLLGLRNYTSFKVREQPVVAAAVFELAIETELTAYDASYL